MLGKLLKYDLRSVGRFWWIAMLTMIGASFSTSVSYRLYLELSMSQAYLSGENNVLIALAMMALNIISIISLVVIGASLIFVAVLIYVRYYKHLFTDEGYLTFTLPVSRKQIYFSKLVNAGLWLMLSELVLFACAMVMLVIVIPSYGKGIIAFDTLEGMLDTFVNSFKERGGWMILQGILGVLLAFAATMLSVGVVYFCITLGATVAKRAKIIVGIGTYYLIDVVTRIFGTALGIVPMVWVIVILLKFSETNIHLFNGATSIMMLMFFAIVSLLAAFFHCLTLNILERKLNLS